MRLRVSLLSSLLALALLAACDDSTSSSGSPAGPGAGGIDSSSLYGKVVDARDGHAYRTVTLGTQTWLAENLVWKPARADGWACLEGKEDSCARCGRYHTWKTALDLPDSCESKRCADLLAAPRQGVCPAGWHVPSTTETDLVLRFFMDSSKLDRRHYMNAVRTAAWKIPGTNQFHFDLLPAGSAYSKPIPSSVTGNHAALWTASEYADAYAIEIDFAGDTTSSAPVSRTGDSKYRLLTVRCLKD